MLKKPEKCCDFGEFKCTVPMPILGRLRDVDYCISDIVAALNAGGVNTVASCCGHDKIYATIILEDGRAIVVMDEFDPDILKEKSKKWECSTK